MLPTRNSYLQVSRAICLQGFGYFAVHCVDPEGMPAWTSTFEFAPDSPPPITVLSAGQVTQNVMGAGGGG